LLALLAEFFEQAEGEKLAVFRLVLILHVGYAFVSFGFLLAGAAVFGIGFESAGIHAWMVGAAGVMTLAVMTRASLGHTGKALVASAATQAIHAAVIIAALARICASLQPDWSEPLLQISVLGWVIAYFGFAAVYGPLLVRAKR